MKSNITTGANEINSIAATEERRMNNEQCEIERQNRIGDHRIRAGLSLAIRYSSFFIFLVFLAVLLPATTFAQSSNRWLLIFDISSSMHGRAKGTHDVMDDLLRTGMHGQIRSGDTIGIWTFNDKLHTGEAPLQVWTPDESQIIYRHTIQYLDGLRYGKSANMDVVLTNVFNVVDLSQFITIVLFSDGDQPLNGTPFDEQINNLYKQNYHHQKKEDMPIITVLQAKRGSFIANTVNFAPWPVDIPATPLPPPKPVAPQISPAPKTAPPPSTVPPLIYDGRKDPANQSLPAPTTETSPSTAEVPVDNSNASAASVITEQATAASKPETAAPLPTTTTAIETTQPAATPPAEVSESTEPQSKPTATPTPAPVAQNESEPPALQPETASKPVAPRTVEAVSAAPQVNLLSARNIAIFSVAFTVIVVGLLIVSARHSRASQASLITRSLEREKR